MQVHLRGGAVIPMQKPGNTTTESRKNDYTLLVVLDDAGEAAGDVFLDDGVSIDIKRYVIHKIKLIYCKNYNNIFGVAHTIMQSY